MCDRKKKLDPGKLREANITPAVRTFFVNELENTNLSNYCALKSSHLRFSFHLIILVGINLNISEACLCLLLLLRQVSKMRNTLHWINIQ